MEYKIWGISLVVVGFVGMWQMRDKPALKVNKDTVQFAKQADYQDPQTQSKVHTHISQTTVKFIYRHQYHKLIQIKTKVPTTPLTGENMEETLKRAREEWLQSMDRLNVKI